MPESTSPSLNDIARAAGVSAMAVSYALRGKGHVSAATRTKILREAKRLGYRVDPVLTHLMQHLRRRRIRRAQANLGLLVLERDAYTADLIAGARTRASHLGYALDQIDVTGFCQNPAGLTRMLRARGISGLLLSPCRLPQQVTSWLDWSHFSVVAMTHSVVSPNFHRTVPNHFENAVKVLRALRAAGYRRPTFAINRTVQERSKHAFVAALAWAANEWDEPVTPLFVARENPPHGLPGVGAWFRQQRPDALILTGARHIKSELLPELGARAIARLGLAAMSYDPAFPISGIDQQAIVLATTAVDHLVAQIHRQERGIPPQPIVSMVEGKWVDAKPPPTGARGRALLRPVI